MFKVGDKVQYCDGGIIYEITAIGQHGLIKLDGDAVFCNSDDFVLVKEKPAQGGPKQIGGDHYAKMKYQPWDFITDNNLGYLEGSIIKYVSRFRSKGGIEDLRKAAHFLEKLIEVEAASPSA